MILEGWEKKEDDYEEFIDQEFFDVFSNIFKHEHERVFSNQQNLIFSITQYYSDDVKQQIIEAIQHLNQVRSDSVCS